MHKPTLTLVGTESLSKVSPYAENAMYLFHDGEKWKFGKVGELKEEKFENLLYCTTCGQHYYYTGKFQVQIFFCFLKDFCPMSNSILLLLNF